MSLFFKKVERGNPSDPQAPKKWYPVLKSIGKVKEKDVARDIADETTLNPKEAEMAIYQSQKVILKALLDGKTVQLGGLGTFQLTITNKEGVDSADKVSANQIERVNLRFVPSEEVREKLRKANFVPVEKL